MALSDEEDNDLYGKTAKRKKTPCVSCKDLTSLGVATGPRAQTGLCVGCFETHQKQTYQLKDGTVVWKEVSNHHIKRTPFDGGRNAK